MKGIRIVRKELNMKNRSVFIFFVLFIVVCSASVYGERFSLDYETGDFGVMLGFGMTTMEDMMDIDDFNMDQEMVIIGGVYAFTDDFGLKISVPFMAMQARA